MGEPTTSLDRCSNGSDHKVTIAGHFQGDLKIGTTLVAPPGGEPVSCPPLPRQICCDACGAGSKMSRVL